MVAVNGRGATGGSGESFPLGEAGKLLAQIVGSRPQIKLRNRELNETIPFSSAEFPPVGAHLKLEVDSENE